MTSPADLSAPAAAAATPSAERLGPEWPAQVADTITSFVDTIAKKTTVPITTVTRAVVYGIVIAWMAVVAAVLVAVALDRLLVIAWAELGVGVWAAHATLGAIFLLAGLFLWRKRRARDSA